MAAGSNGVGLPEHLVLKIVIPDGNPSEILARLSPGQCLTVGRSSRNAIVIPNPCVSREHMLLSWEGAQPTVRDLNTRNGTRINQQPVTEESPLQVGDCVEISSTKILVLPPQNLPEAVSATKLAARPQGEIHASSGIQRRLGSLDLLDDSDTLIERTRGRPFSFFRRCVIVAAGCGLGLAIFSLLLHHSL